MYKYTCGLRWDIRCLEDVYTLLILTATIVKGNLSQWVPCDWYLKPRQLPTKPQEWEPRHVISRALRVCLLSTLTGPQRGDIKQTHVVQIHFSFSIILSFTDTHVLIPYSCFEGRNHAHIFVFLGSKVFQQFIPNLIEGKFQMRCCLDMLEGKGWIWNLKLDFLPQENCPEFGPRGM